MGGVAMGGVAVGVVAVGGVTMGVVAVGGVAIGGVAMEGVAMGVVTVGGVVMGGGIWYDQLNLTMQLSDFAVRGHLTEMRMPGVEPGSQAWEACMMPLHYVRSHWPSQGACY